jgi:hypothetical protein
MSAPRRRLRESLMSRLIELCTWAFQENLPDPFFVFRHPRRFEPKSKNDRKWPMSTSSGLMRAMRAERMSGLTERARMPRQKLRAYVKEHNTNIMCTW